MGIYWFLFLSFYTIPTAWVFLRGFFSFEWLEIFREGLIVILALLFFAMTATIFIALPIALITFYLKAFFRKFKQFKIQFSSKSAWVLTLGIIVINIFLFRFLNWNQPQEYAFEKLKTSDKQVDENYIIANEDKIKKGLLNAYLAPYRYISEVHKNNHIQEMYRDFFEIEKEKAKYIQLYYNILSKPLLYEGHNFSSDKHKSEKYYQEIFDQPIQKAERKAIKKALNSTWEREEIEAGLLNLNEEKVLILEQKVEIEEHEDWAEIEIFETYQNQTFQQQEIFYYFDLPRNASITGLWLSDEKEIEKKYSYKVSSRGAAQAVYKAEVQRRVDPSLLEQVGPTQYRLRAFPILPKRYTRTWNRGRRKSKEIKEGEKFYLWLSFKVLVDKNDAWQMPKLLEKRNVFWNDKTKFSINKKEKLKSKKEAWLPNFLKAKNPIKRRVHQSQINDSTSLIAFPKTQEINALKNQKIAFLIDQSYSMNQVEKDLKNQLKTLETKYSNLKYDFYLTGFAPEKVKNIETILDKKWLFYGTTQPLEMLAQFDSLNNGKQYEALAILTDEGTTELASDSAKIYNSNCPIYLIHLGEKKTHAYQDVLFQTLQKSKGDAFSSMEKMFDKMAFQNQKMENDLTYENGYLWQIEKVKNPQSKADGFADLAAKQFIKYQIENMNLDSLENLDKIHATAKHFGVVSPFSSMIVLVNDRQFKALEEAEKRKDRFEREVESGVETLSKPSNPFDMGVSGTPEPEEWLLISLIAIFLAFVVWKKNLI